MRSSKNGDPIAYGMYCESVLKENKLIRDYGERGSIGRLAHELLTSKKELTPDFVGIEHGNDKVVRERENRIDAGFKTLLIELLT